MFFHGHWMVVWGFHGIFLGYHGDIRGYTSNSNQLDMIFMGVSENGL